MTKRKSKAPRFRPGDVCICLSDFSNLKGEEVKIVKWDSGMEAYEITYYGDKLIIYYKYIPDRELKLSDIWQNKEDIKRLLKVNNEA